MSGKRKLVSLVIAAAGVLVILLCTFLFRLQYDRQNYERQITLGKRYYAVGDYEKAAVRFQRAIALEPQQAEAYEGLARVYTVQGDEELALGILEIGWKRTGSETLRYQITDLTPGKLSYAVTKLSPVLQEKLLRLLKEDTYNEYRLKNKNLTGELQADGSCVVTVQDPSATLTFSSDAVDAVSGRPSSDSVPAKITMSNIMDLFGEGLSVTKQQLEELGAKGLVCETNQEHGTVVCFTLNDCSFTVSCDEDGTVFANAWNEIVPPEKKEEEEPEEQEQIEKIELSGRVINAVSGEGASGVSVIFAPQSSEGQERCEATTGAQGIYTVEITPGEYRVTVQGDGFVEENFTVYAESGTSEEALTFTVSPTLAVGEIRIVLEWGETPRDLDSHLRGTLDGGETVNVYYGRTSASVHGELAAELDVDDRDGFGPETTTIYATGGHYVFWVEDFKRTGTMAQSGAVVKIYTDNQSAPMEIPISEDCENIWYVCEIDGGEITVTNHG